MPQGLTTHFNIITRIVSQTETRGEGDVGAVCYMCRGRQGGGEGREWILHSSLLWRAGLSEPAHVLWICFNGNGINVLMLGRRVACMKQMPVSQTTGESRVGGRGWKLFCAGGTGVASGNQV